ncbi:MAG: hypothetical protein ACO3EZ_07005, partial [Prochlorotrichaceae cyanobacterium]
MTETLLYRGQGVVSAAERSPSGEPLGFTDLGNCPRFEIRPLVTQIEHRENRTGSGFLDAIVETGLNCQVQLELDSTAGDNLYRLLYGKLENIPAGVIQNEPVTLWTGKASTLQHLGLVSWFGLRDQAGELLIQRTPDRPLAWTVVWDGQYFYSNSHGLQADQPVRLLGVNISPFNLGQDYYAIPIDTNQFQLTDTIAAPPIVGGSTFTGLAIGIYDYQVDLKTGTITLPSTSRISNGKTAWANYAYANAERLYGFVTPSQPVTLLFRGKNTYSDRPLRVRIHRVKLDPTTAWQLIGESWSRFEVEGLVLLDKRHPNLFTADFWSDLYIPPPPPPPTYNYANINPEAIDDYAVPIGFANIDPELMNDYPLTRIRFANID